MMAVDGNARDGGGWRPAMVISEMVVDGVLRFGGGYLVSIGNI